MKTETGHWAWPVVGALFCLALGTASGLSSVGGGDAWYQDLVRPPGTPPPWVFGPVWSILYLMMGVAWGRLIQRGAKQATVVFGTQFMLNLVWTPVFFGMHEIAAALAVIVAIWLGVAATLVLAWKCDKISAGLLVPYGLWLTYASYLNAGFFVLNR